MTDGLVTAKLQRPAGLAVRARAWNFSATGAAGLAPRGGLHKVCAAAPLGAPSAVSRSGARLLIGKVVHLLTDLLAGPALPQLDLLEHRRVVLMEGELARSLAEVAE